MFLDDLYINKRLKNPFESLRMMKKKTKFMMVMMMIVKFMVLMIKVAVKNFKTMKNLMLKSESKIE